MNTKKQKKQIRSSADLQYSIYVVIVPCTRRLLHWRGYKKYEKARSVSAKVGGIVSSSEFLRGKFGRRAQQLRKAA